MMESISQILSSELENLRLMDTSCSPPPGPNTTAITAPSDKTVPDNKAEIEGTENIYFNPPIYLQRYAAVQSVLNELLKDPSNRDELNGRTVMEVGCAEFGMHIFMKSILELGKIIYLDIDEKLLMDRKDKLKPLPAEYLQKPTRVKPLVVEAYAGDITCVDNRIVQENPKVWCVVGIELIEHLFPDVLRGFEVSVFGVINPEVVVVTTPNADFNSVFNLLPGNFRHWDHKFEWSRNEFKLWCDKVCLEFPEYGYSTHGIGAGPVETEHLGCVSQMAVFRKHSYAAIKMNQIVSPKEDAYKLLESIIYPNYVEKRTLDQIIIDDVDYLMCHCWLTKRNIEHCMENSIVEFVFSMAEVKAMLPTKTPNVLSADEAYIGNVLLKANKYEIRVIDGSYAIQIPVPLWDQRERDLSEEEGFIDYDEDEIVVDPQNSSAIDTDDSWE